MTLILHYNKTQSIFMLTVFLFIFVGIITQVSNFLAPRGESLCISSKYITRLSYPFKNFVNVLSHTLNLKWSFIVCLTPTHRSMFRYNLRFHTYPCFLTNRLLYLFRYYNEGQTFFSNLWLIKPTCPSDCFCHSDLIYNPTIDNIPVQSYYDNSFGFS